MEGEALRGALWPLEALGVESGLLQIGKTIPGGLDQLIA